MGGEAGLESMPRRGSSFWFGVRLLRAEDNDINRKVAIE